MCTRYFHLPTLLLALFCGFIAACSNHSLRIGNSLELCCPGDYTQYQRFGIKTENIPHFLEDYVVSEFISAFEEKGLEHDDTIRDLEVTLSYRHINLNANQEHIDPFIRNESIQTELRYIAAIDIDMRESLTNKLIWAGEIHRIHTVSPGEYMHQHRAVVAFRETFRDLLRHYPDTTQ